MSRTHFRVVTTQLNHLASLAKCLSLRLGSRWLWVRAPLQSFNNDLSHIIYDQDLVVENEILKVKLEEAEKENTFLKSEVKDLIVLFNAKIQTYSHNFKLNTKECLLQENLDT